jgi:arylsulfatase A-like enzyme
LSKLHRLKIHFKTGLLSGVLAGGQVGILEAVVVILTKPHLPEWWLLLYSPLIYGLLCAAMGGGLGLAVGILSALFGGHPSSSRAYAAYWSLIFTVSALFITRSRIIHDMLTERPSPLHQLLLVPPFIILFLLARLLLRHLLEKTAWRRLPGTRASLGIFVIMLLVASIVAGSFKLVSPHHRVPIPRNIPPILRDKPNVILIVVDALRADRLNCYGYEIKTSPHIDALAADGILFDTCILQSSWTRPSFATFFTSLYPSSHQAIDRPDMLPDAVVTMAELISSEGYFALGLANNPHISSFFNFNQGFDEYIYLKPRLFFLSPVSGSVLTIYRRLRIIRERQIFKAKHVYNYYQDAQVVNTRVFSWLEKLKASRFFLFIHYMETHDPYFVHPYNGVGYAQVSNPEPDPSVAGLYSETYNGELRYVDQAVGELRRWLQDNNLYDDALIIFTSDHGEEFCDHGGWWHATSLYEELIHVPLIVKLPGQEDAGTKDHRMVRGLDIAPSIMAIIDIPPHPSMQGHSFMGETGRSWPGVDEVFSEEDTQGMVIRSLRTRTWKLIQANPNNPRGLPTTALYHLADDPLENTNLAMDRRDLVDVMEPQLEEKMALAERDAVARQQRDIDEVTRERLKSLGYTE